MGAKNIKEKKESRCDAVKDVVLLTPYTGSNLGDAAIQVAAIENIRERHPSVRLRGITLRPEITREMHGIDCFPLITAGMARIGASKGKGKAGKVGGVKYGKRGLLANRYIFFLLKAGLYLPRAGLRVLDSLRNETKHIVKGYEFIKGADHAVFSGGGQLDDHWGGPWHHPYTILKWAVLARVAGARLIFLSIGADHLKSPLTRFFIKRSLSLAHYRSYRDEETKARVADMGVGDGDRVYPDLAFSVCCDTQNHRRQESDVQSRVVVGVSPIGAPAWTTRDSEEFEIYLENLTSLVTWLLSANYTVLFFPSQTTDDPPLIEEIKERLVASGVYHDAGQILSEPVRDVDELLQQIAMTDIVVASRFHSVLLAICLCRPVLALSYRSKVNNLMEDAGFPQYCLDINRVQTEDLKALVSALSENRGVISEHLARRVRAYAQALDEQYDIVFGRASNSVNDASVSTR